MKISGLDDLQVWRNAASVCRTATFFHTVDWYKAFADGRNNMLRPLRIDFPDGKTAVFPMLEIQTEDGRSRYHSGPAGVYGGWIGHPPLDPGQARLASAAVRRQTGNLFWRSNPFDETQACVVDRNWRRDFTQYLDLRPGFESVFRGWSKGHRAAVGQALRSGVSVRVAASIPDWRSYYQCYLASLARWGKSSSSSYDWPLFKYFSALPQDSVRLWLAEGNGQLLAGALVFYHGRHAVYWHGAAYGEHFRARPANLLQHEIIRHASAIGIQIYDFNPSGGHEGVAAFKHGFGAKALPASYLNQCPRSAWQRIAAGTQRLLSGRGRL